MPRGGATIDHIDDPRVESEEHYYRAAHTKLLDLGLLPYLLGDELLGDLLGIARAHADRIEVAALRPHVNWRRTSSAISRLGAAEGSADGAARPRGKHSHIEQN